MNVPLVDLKAQLSTIKGEVDDAIKRVLEHGMFILGPEVKALEEEVASYLDTQFAIGVASGTDALYLALLACEVTPGDEVITTPFTFVATAEVIVHCGAKPVYVDINPHTYNIDPKKIEEKITPRTKVILPVHLYGQAADMDPILDIAQKYHIKVVEDCAQALGTEYRGKKVGSLGNAGCLSFFPSKNLGAYGDGGMVVTNDASLAETVDILHKHGARTSYYYLRPGFNSRLDTIQAAILGVKLKRLDKWLEHRRQKAAIYQKLLQQIEDIDPPCEEGYGRHSFNYYTLRLRNNVSRNRLRKYLESKGVQTAIYYPLSLHLQEGYKYLGYKPGDFPESERAQEEVLSLPMYSELTEKQAEEVVIGIKEFYRNSS